MPEDVKKRKMTEEDVMELGLRYSPSTIISLLQEVSEHTSKHPDSKKIDWNALIKTTYTGISNAREYQMLWRHLAYHNPLLEKIEEGAEPLDDDSDLEIELEAVPAPNPEELAEAKACAKVILSAGSTPRPVADASLNVDTLNDHAVLDPLPDTLAGSTCGGSPLTTISNPKAPLSTGPSSEVLEGNGAVSSGLPAKKKRQLWTKEEDMELIAAVQKCGEGNWANILKGDFKHNRTATQLSQRWALIRKRHVDSNPGNGNNTNSAARSEERLAAQKAFSLAVDMPMTGSLSLFSGATHMASSSTSSAATSQASRACAAQSLNQSQDKGIASLIIQARPTLKKPSIPGNALVGGPNPLIKAAAFAAGGRIANPSTAASLFKAAQSKNAVHIKPGGGSSLPIPSTMVSKPSSTSNTSGPQSSQHPQPALPPLTQPLPASFGTTLSSLRSSQHAIVPSAGCTAESDLSCKQASAGSKLEAIQHTKSRDNAEGKCNVDNGISDVDAEELVAEELGGSSVEAGLASAAKREGHDICSNTPSDESQTVGVKEAGLQNEAAVALEPGLVADAGGAQMHSQEPSETGSAEDVCPGNQIVGDKLLEKVNTVVDGKYADG